MIKKNWKRWLLSAFAAAALMFADTVALAQVNKWYRPGRPPAWLVNCFYYVLAWPLAFTRLIFPRSAQESDEGPTFPAVAAAGLVDLFLLTVLIYALLSWRARRRESRARA